MSRNSKIITAESLEASLNIEDVIGRYTHLTSFRGGWIGLCPFHEEKTPSFHVKPSGLFTCFGCGKSSIGIINFIKLKENLDFKDSLEFLSKNYTINTSKEIIKRPEIKKSTPILYEFEDMPFTEKHHKYWNAGGLSEEFVNKQGDIYAVKKWAINKKVQPLDYNNIMFGYVHRNKNGDETGKYKFLTLGPNVSKIHKWRTNVSNNQLWYLYKIQQECKQVFIAKSNKDALINDLCGICSIATQSENDKVLSKNIPILQKMYSETKFVINFGSDEQGKQCSINVSKEFNLDWFNTPNDVLKYFINDNFEYVKAYGLNNYIKLLKEKHYL